MTSQPGEAAPGRRRSWRTGRLSRWRRTYDARLRQAEGLPPDDEPGAVEGFLRDRLGVLDAMLGDQDEDEQDGG